MQVAGPTSTWLKQWLIASMLMCAGPLATAARPPFVAAPHLETADGFIPLRFTSGKWLLQGGPTDDSAVLVVANNVRAYATIEVFGEDLDSSVTLQFLNGQSGQILDKVVIDAGTSPAALRTIPLVSRRILVKTVGAPPGVGQVTVSRVLVPKPSAGVPHGLMESIMPVSHYRGTVDPSRRALYDAAASVPLLQIAKPTETVICTAFLVAKDTLATAGHCVRMLMPNESTADWEQAPCASIGILFDFVDASASPVAPAVHCLAVRVLPKAEAPVGLLDLPSLTLDVRDVAVLRIDPTATRRADGRLRQPLPLKDLSDESFASVISYPQGDIEGVANDCEVYGNLLKTLVPHRCSTAPGSSGAPVLELTEDGWQVVGLHICCDGGPIDGSTRPQLINAGKRINLSLRPSLISDLIK